MRMDRVLYRAYQIGQDLLARFLTWPKAISVTGENCRQKIPSILSTSGVTKAMVVTGSHVGKSIAPGIIEDLRTHGIDCYHFDRVEANPSTDTVYKIRDLYLTEHCNGFLAIGGGSPMDAAKAAACLIVRPRKNLAQMSGLFKVLRKLPPFVAVPTTAGTGSENTIAAVITEAETHRKYAIMDLNVIPSHAIMDPVLTAGLPPMTTAATGMDALTHAVEAYICWNNRTKESRQLAEEAVVLIFCYLERAFLNGNDMEAREGMLEAAYKAGYAFSRSGVGNVHALAHPMSGLYGTPHGLANAVILPIVLEDYGHVIDSRLARLAECTGIKTTGTQTEKAQAFIAAIYAMNERMGIPRHLDVICEKDIMQITKWALHEANPVYPVPVIYDAARCKQVLKKIADA